MTSHGFIAKLVIIPLLSRALCYVVVGYRHAFIIFTWNGRTGNNIKQLTNAVVSAKREGGWMVVLPPHRGPIHEVMRPPGIIFMEEFGRSRSRGIWGWARIDMWHGLDKEFPKEPHEEQALRTLLRPYFRKRLATCLESPEEEGAEETLTIHIRSGDIFTAENWWDPKHRQAPCAFFRRVLREGNGGRAFRRALVLTESDRQNPCASWLEMQDLATVQSGAIWEDACAILRARNLVVARSSFSETLARLSDRVRRVFTFDLKPCCCGGGDPTREVYRYEIPEVEELRMSTNQNRQWLLGYPEERVAGPFLCNASELAAGSY